MCVNEYVCESTFILFFIEYLKKIKQWWKNPNIYLEVFKSHNDQELNAPDTNATMGGGRIFFKQNYLSKHYSVMKGNSF